MLHYINSLILSNHRSVSFWDFLRSGSGDDGLSKAGVELSRCLRDRNHPENVLNGLRRLESLIDLLEKNKSGKPGEIPRPVLRILARNIRLASLELIIYQPENDLTVQCVRTTLAFLYALAKSYSAQLNAAPKRKQKELRKLLIEDTVDACHLLLNFIKTVGRYPAFSSIVANDPDFRAYLQEARKWAMRTHKEISKKRATKKNRLEKSYASLVEEFETTPI